MIKKGYSKEHTIGRVAQVLLLLFICLVSCQNDKVVFDNEVNDGRFMILPVFQQQEMEISTKALINNTYEIYAPEDGELIYAWARRYAPTDSLILGEFRRSGSKWNSSVEVKGGQSYKMFAFQPGGISESRGTLSESNGNYILTVSPINIVTLGEPSIAIAAARSYYDTDLGGYNDPIPSPGNYDLGEITNNSENDKVLLAMNHLYSKVNLSFTLDTVYSKLRTVVITGINIVTAHGQASMTLTFNQNSNPSYIVDNTSDTLKVNLPIPGDSIILNATTTTSWSGNHFDGYQYLDAGSFCYLPKADLPIKLVVTYDVYVGDTDKDQLTDQNYKDRLVRKGQTATNAKIMPSGNGIPKAGYKYDVKIGVKPSYLYQLSDDDLDIRLTIE